MHEKKIKFTMILTSLYPQDIGFNKTLEKVEDVVKIVTEVSVNNNTDSKLILEANQGVNIRIYDEKGLIKWNFIEALTAKYLLTGLSLEHLG
jgi:hypothetical protein